MPNLNALLRARSVAILGASGKRDTFGWHVVRQLIDFGYGGRIYPVNPGYRDIEGFACYPSLDAIPGSVDCVAICVADARIEAAFHDVIAAGIPAAVIFGAASGVSNTGTPLTESLQEMALEADIALMGANCMGFLNFTDSLFVTGYPYHREPRAGTISLITHSGSTLSAIAKNTRDMTFNYVISPGQELVLSAADYLRFVLEQPETRVVGLFLETIRDPAGFCGALELAMERGIPIVMLKVGRTEAGAKMALAHTGALAGAQATIEALAHRYNVALVRTVEEMLDTLELFNSGRRPSATGLGAITDSGGERGMMVDLASDIGIEFGTLASSTIAVLADTLDPGIEPGNPADLWGSGRDWQHVFRTCIHAMLADDTVGAFSFGIDFNIGSRLGPDYRQIAIEAFHSTSKPFAVVTNVAAGINPDEAAALRAEGIPVLMGAETGLLAFRHLFDFYGRESARNASFPESRILDSHSQQSSDLLRLSRPLTEPESMEVLSRFGLVGVEHRIAGSVHEAILAAEAIGYPVVIKTAEPGNLHKSDRGGVHLGIASPEQLDRAYSRLSHFFGPPAVVQKQIDTRDGVELFLGMTVDSQFGPLVTVGLGGIWIEVLHDAITFLAPCEPAEVLRRLPALRGFPLLNGARGTRPVDLHAFAGQVALFSWIADVLAKEVDAIDINPLLACGDTFTMLDALIVPTGVLREADGRD